MTASAPLLRRVLILTLIAVSIIPQMVMAFALGLINIVLLVILWGLCFLAAMRMSKGVFFVAAALFALMMAIPPSPNYIGMSKSGWIFWNPIGVEKMFSDPSSVAFFFLFYFAIFSASYFLFNPKEGQRQTNGTGGN